MHHFADCIKFLFIELNELKEIYDFKENQRIGVFEYFESISELFFASYMDVYHFVSKGFTQVKLFAM